MRDPNYSCPLASPHGIGKQVEDGRRIHRLQVFANLGKAKHGHYSQRPRVANNLLVRATRHSSGFGSVGSGAFGSSGFVGSFGFLSLFGFSGGSPPR